MNTTNLETQTLGSPQSISLPFCALSHSVSLPPRAVGLLVTPQQYLLATVYQWESISDMLPQQTMESFTNSIGSFIILWLCSLHILAIGSYLNNGIHDGVCRTVKNNHHTCVWE